ncbi:15459_t:CDS:2 [Entrophospora sp. SA101]|nr:15459_t:CDS:2 [Entrophospora sp. SA101]CAJ0854304.1 7262_t:CDS:2 [Entrophospora sp. SA101]
MNQNEQVFNTILPISSLSEEDSITDLFDILINNYKNNDRIPCKLCNKPVKYYCYYCYKIVGIRKDDEKFIPKLKLPIKIDIVKHNQELDGKSTAPHAKLIAPDDVEIYSHENIPEITNPDRVLLLFPDPDAKLLKDISLDSFDKLIVVDGTWRQAISMTKKNPTFRKLRKVTIKPQKTLFWRYQNKNENYLATIEAIYYFLREYDEISLSNNNSSNSNSYDYDGKYDNLLWYYKYFYELIQETYRNNEMYGFKIFGFNMF